MTENALLGAWKLVSMEGRFDDGRVVRPLGDEPEGYLIYSADGWVSAMLLQGNRKPLDSGFGPTTMLTPEEREYVLGTMTAAYQATYTLDGDTVTHHIKAAVHPNMKGLDEVRTFTLNGDRLLIQSSRLTQNGSLVTTLEWVKA